MVSCFFFFNDTATTEIYTLSLHDALPILAWFGALWRRNGHPRFQEKCRILRSEEHTSELQSRQYLVCRLLLEKKKYHIIEFTECGSCATRSANFRTIAPICLYTFSFNLWF